jgi:hypothetical protein
MSAKDRQVGGDHYKMMAVEPWSALEAWMTPSELLGYLKGTAIAYLARSGQRGDIDVRKAHHVLDRLIEILDARDVEDLRVGAAAPDEEIECDGYSQGLGDESRVPGDAAHSSVSHHGSDALSARARARSTERDLRDAISRVLVEGCTHRRGKREHSQD